MRKVIYLLLAVGLIYWGYRRSHAPPSISEMPKMPDTLAWRVVKDEDVGAGLCKVCVVDGVRWRVEARGKDGAVVVAVSDGQKVMCSDARVSGTTLDPRPALQGLYAALPGYKLTGDDPQDGRPAWRFDGQKDGNGVTIWVDKETGFPARTQVALAGGATRGAKFTGLSIDVRAADDRIFDVRLVKPMFGIFLEPGMPVEKASATIDLTVPDSSVADAQLVASAPAGKLNIPTARYVWIYAGTMLNAADKPYLATPDVHPFKVIKYHPDTQRLDVLVHDINGVPYTLNAPADMVSRVE